MQENGHRDISAGKGVQGHRHRGGKVTQPGEQELLHLWRAPVRQKVMESSLQGEERLSDAVGHILKAGGAKEGGETMVTDHTPMTWLSNEEAECSIHAGAPELRDALSAEGGGVTLRGCCKSKTAPLASSKTPCPPSKQHFNGETEAFSPSSF